MEIDGLIQQFKPYQTTFSLVLLPIYSLEQIIDTGMPSKRAFRLEIGTNVYAISTWTGPKRTRTYPYKDVYNTMNHKPRVALIPFVKDEGKSGDRDFLQWDTVSLMTLLGVYVILTYHVSGERSKKPGKVTRHRIDLDYFETRMTELSHYGSDPVHWNHREMDEFLPIVVERAISGQHAIESVTGVPLHNPRTLYERQTDLKNFQDNSRKQSLAAQQRETTTEHRHERAASGAKSSINIRNWYRGEYRFTVDEAYLLNGQLFLIEKKHGSGIMPGTSDIKDGLLKMMLYHNLERATVEGTDYQPIIVLGLTSERVIGYCRNRMSKAALEIFVAQNGFSVSAIIRLQGIFAEADVNNFSIYLVNADKEGFLKEQLLSEIVVSLNSSR